jgi:DNA repair protein RecO (recombination protein O)
MNRPRVYRAEAVVLKAFDYGEADRILTLFTSQQGKIRAIAKGVRKIKSRKSGHLDLFMRSNLLLARGRQLDIVTQAETLETFLPMRSDLWRASQGQYVAELIESFSAENLPSYPLYALLVATLRRLATSENLALAIRSFEVQLLTIVGYRPQLHRCLNCDTAIQPEANRFSPKLGGVLCPACVAADSAAPQISVPALKVLRNLQTNEGAMLAVTDVGESIEREVEQRLQEYIAHRLESRPRAVSFLEHMRAQGMAP